MLGLAAAATTPLPLAPAPAPAVVSDQPSATAAFASVPVKTIYVTRLTDAGRGSLRQALERANASKPRGITVVYFRRRGVIRLRHGLPVIRRTVLIDGNSAPTHHLGGPPVVELNCAGHAGLRFGRGSNGSQLLGFAVVRAGGNGVSLAAGSITIAGDYLGLSDLFQGFRGVRDKLRNRLARVLVIDHFDQELRRNGNDMSPGNRGGLYVHHRSDAAHDNFR